MKALFVPFAPSLAHTSRCLAVAQAWQARGHAAVFAVGPEREPLVRTAGFQAHPLPEVSGEAFRTTGIGWMTSQYLSENVAAERAILEQVQPDVVVSSFRFTTGIASRLAERRSVSILHGSALSFAFLPPRILASRLVGDPGSVRGARALRARVLKLAFPFMFQQFMHGVIRRWGPLLRAYGYPPVDSPYALLLGDEVFAADLAEFLPTERPPRTHVTGPIVWSGWETPAPWLDELDGRPLVYVTLGSTIQAQSILIKIVDALRELPVNVVVSTGGLSLPHDLKLPACFRLFPTVPGATVLRRSQAVIHLGGHGTLMQALAAGVPSLLLPSNPDQIVVAQDAHALGVGLSLWRPGHLPIGDAWQKSLTSPEIKRAVEQMMSDVRFRRACEGVKQRLEGRPGGASAAAEKLEEIASAGSD